MERVRHSLQHFESIDTAIRRCIDRVAQLAVVVHATLWIRAVLHHPLTHRLRIAIARASAFTVGTTFIDEQTEFSKLRLVKNDEYRDRLLESEIADLVDVCEALKMTLAQRKALFRCFRHLDFTRRSTVSRLELLRYCNLRASPLTTYLLPVPAAVTHRTAIAKRWDISQFFAACFSVCTADPAQLVCEAIAEALRSTVAESPLDTPDQSNHHHVSPLLDHINRCAQFFIGVPSPIEKKVVKLLHYLYGDVKHVDFKAMHRVNTVVDVVALFPVLVFPCIWVHHVLSVRILGTATWRSLMERREELPNGFLPQFFQFSDIISASSAENKQNQQGVEAWSLWSRFKFVGHAISKKSNFVNQHDSLLIAPMLMKKKPLERSHSSNGRGSTPRKILPVETEQNHPHPVEVEHLQKMTRECCTLSSAWKVTATNLLASVYILDRIEDGGYLSTKDLVAIFAESVNAILDGSLSRENCQSIYKRISNHYGYQFAQELFVKSSLSESVSMTKKSMEERRARDRYSKAWNGTEVPDDYGRYWKQFVDPVEELPFYYNVRTGESQWERPSSCVANTRRRKAKKKKSSLRLH